MSNIKIIQVRKNEGIKYKNIDMIVTAKAVAKKIISHGYNIVPLFPNAKNTNEPNWILKKYSNNDFLDNNDGEYKSKLSAYHNKKYLLDSKLLVEWDNLRKLMWQKNQLISPGGFVKQFNM